MVNGVGVSNQESTSFSSSDARSGGFLAVPLKAIRECGSCSQSLAGLLSVLRLDGGKITYRSRDELAKSAGLPVRTWTRHAAELRRLGFIEQQHTPNDSSTTTITTDSATWFSDGFLPLPRWVVAERMPWAWRIVYCWVVYRAELSLDSASCEDSLNAMARALGLTRRSVINAIHGLIGRGLITREQVSGSTATTRLKTPKLGGEKMARTWCKSGSASGEKMARPTLPKKFLNKNSDQKRADRELSVESGDVPRLAHELFRRSQYTEHDGGIFWVVAGAVVAGLITERDAIDAANGCAECKPNNRPGYFRTILQRNLRRRGEQLDVVMRRVTLSPHTPTDPPVRRSVGLVRFNSP
jgi:DNA-binding MarR family transcriptional regulator